MTPRAKFIAKSSQRHIAKKAWDAMQQASRHDPELLKAILNLDKQIAELYSRMKLCERRLDRIGAPQYRRVR